MSRVSQDQMKKLLDLLCEDGVMVKGKLMYPYSNRQCFWKKVAIKLNSIPGACKMPTNGVRLLERKSNGSLYNNISTVGLAQIFVTIMSIM